MTGPVDDAGGLNAPSVREQMNRPDRSNQYAEALGWMYEALGWISTVVRHTSDMIQRFVTMVFHCYA